MRITFLVLAGTLLTPVLLQAQRACKELQPTLHGYRVAEYGENYADGPRVIPNPSDSEVCEKLRQDASVYSCRFRKARATAESSYRLANNMLGIAQRRMSMNPRRVVGGEAANQRVIRDSTDRARRAQARLTSSRLEMEQNRTPYRATVGNLKQNSCFYSYEDREHEDPVLKEHPLLDVVESEAEQGVPESVGDALERVLDALGVE